MTAPSRPSRLVALLLCLALAISALAMPPPATAVTGAAVHHAHAAHAAVPGAAEAGVADDLACAIGCTGVFDPTGARPFAGPARQMTRLPFAEAAIAAEGREPAPMRHPPRRSTTL
ncbi:MAG: hypothetical protein Q8Q63_07050 [Phaeovulum sp.]|uniref:hypothetical protein n=1 Tax=Phaeovulum sp. TaxID=2934796 RepID=UPI0027367F6A|nr:hypothetical protein [Phaeovulum sp.]MDP3861326.1 hypothetical protein [Phaeovulum sp.]